MDQRSRKLIPNVSQAGQNSVKPPEFMLPATPMQLARKSRPKQKFGRLKSKKI